jgi:hypothetical protein
MRLGWTWLAVAKALAFNTAVLITSVKHSIEQTSGACTIKLFMAVIVAMS